MARRPDSECRRAGQPFRRPLEANDMKHTKILALLVVCVVVLAACVPASTQRTVDINVSGLPGEKVAAPLSGGGATRGSNLVTTVDRLRVTRDLQVDGTTTNSGTQTYTGALAADGGI